jgi:putative acetyltransferase
MTIALRAARLADALGMAVVHRDAVHAAMPGIYDRAIRDTWAPPVDLDRAERLYREAQAEGAASFVVEMHSELAGFVQVEPASGHIGACYVAPKAARRGLGRALMRASEDAARAANATHLSVRSSTFALPFYRSLGFAVTARTSFAFPDGTAMPVVLMEKKLAA